MEKYLIKFFRGEQVIKREIVEAIDNQEAAKKTQAIIKKNGFTVSTGVSKVTLELLKY